MDDTLIFLLSIHEAALKYHNSYETCITRDAHTCMRICMYEHIRKCHKRPSILVQIK